MNKDHHSDHKQPAVFTYIEALGYDGAAAMSDQFNGCAAKILAQYAQLHMLLIFIVVITL